MTTKLKNLLSRHERLETRIGELMSRRVEVEERIAEEKGLMTVEALSKFEEKFRRATEPQCQYCGRVMSENETRQGACNDCTRQKLEATRGGTR